jgi:PadR family transcriptional regulator PadR
MTERRYLSQLELMVLLGVLRAGREAYGVSIAREIEAQTRGPVALASVYAALERLEERGLVKSERGEPLAERGGRARTYYRLTAAGLRYQRETREVLMRLWEGVELIAPKGQS